MSTDDYTDSDTLFIEAVEQALGVRAAMVVGRAMEGARDE